MVTKDDWTAARTGLLCAAVFYLCYGVGIVKERFFENSSINDIAWQLMGYQTITRPRKHVKMGPHSYHTLLLSVGVTVILLAIIWLITIVPKLFKMASLNSFFNQRKFADGENYEGFPASGSTHDEQNLIDTDFGALGDSNEKREFSQPSVNVSSKKKIHVNIVMTSHVRKELMCDNLERRMDQLEARISPLAESLQLLTELLLTEKPPKDVDFSGRSFAKKQDQLAELAEKPCFNFTNEARQQSDTKAITL